MQKIRVISNLYTAYLESLWTLLFGNWPKWLKSSKKVRFGWKLVYWFVITWEPIAKVILGVNSHSKWVIFIFEVQFRVPFLGYCTLLYCMVKKHLRVPNDPKCNFIIDPCHKMSRLPNFQTNQTIFSDFSNFFYLFQCQKIKEIHSFHQKVFSFKWELLIHVHHLLFQGETIWVDIGTFFDLFDTILFFRTKP